MHVILKFIQSTSFPFGGVLMTTWYSGVISTENLDREGYSRMCLYPFVSGTNINKCKLIR